MLHNLKQFDASRCHGCGLCAMVCPVFQQGGSVMTTPQGMAKALQAGGQLNVDDVNACILCGACTPLCPQDIDLMQLLVQLRADMNQQDMTDVPSTETKQQSSKEVFIADHDLVEGQTRLAHVFSILGDSVELAADQGSDIAQAMRQGRYVSKQRVDQFITSLQSVKQIVVSDGLLQHLIRSKLPQIQMRSLGQVLSERSDIQKQFSANDLYVMDSQSYHANHKSSVRHYDELHCKTGVQLNRDLHCLAIPTGSQATNETGACQPAGQITWLMQGRTFERVIVESLADRDAIAKHTDHNVVYILELVA